MDTDRAAYPRLQLQSVFPPGARPQRNDLATTEVILVDEHGNDRNPGPASTTFAGTGKVWWRCTAANHEVLQSVPNRRKTRGCLCCPRYGRVLLD